MERWYFLVGVFVGAVALKLVELIIVLALKGGP